MTVIRALRDHSGSLRRPNRCAERERLESPDEANGKAIFHRVVCPLLEGAKAAGSSVYTPKPSRAAFLNSKADISHSAAKNPVRNTITSGQFAPAEPNPPNRAIMPTNT
jgi:hypothetical protein